MVALTRARRRHLKTYKVQSKDRPHPSFVVAKIPGLVKFPRAFYARNNKLVITGQFIASVSSFCGPHEPPLIRGVAVEMLW